jgi:hypothetical protein
VQRSWRLSQVASVDVPAPRAWTQANEHVRSDDEVHADADEDEVAQAISDNRITPVMLTASR